MKFILSISTIDASSTINDGENYLLLVILKPSDSEGISFASSLLSASIPHPYRQTVSHR